MFINIILKFIINLKHLKTFKLQYIKKNCNKQQNLTSHVIFYGRRHFVFNG